MTKDIMIFDELGLLLKKDYFETNVVKEVCTGSIEKAVRVL